MINLATLTAAITTSAGDKTQDSAVNSDLPLTDGTQPESFVNQLGQHLQALARRNPVALQGALHQSGKAQTAMEKTGVQALSSADLTALVASLSTPQPQASQPDGEPKADTEGDYPAGLTDGELQALQALSTMLNTNIVPATVADKMPLAGQLHQESGLDLAIRGEKQRGDNLLQAAAAGGAEHARPQHEDLSTHNLKASPPATNPAATAAQTADMLQTAGRTLADTAREPHDEPQATSVLNTSHALAMPAVASSVTASVSQGLVNAPSTPLLNAQLGSDEWQQALGQQILMFNRNGQQTAELRLHPQDLGSIQISLKLDNDQAQLNMVSGHTQVRNALEAAIPQLRAALAESGITLGQSNVSSDNFPQDQAFTGQQDQRNNSGGKAFALPGEQDNSVTPLAVPASLQARAEGRGAVDIFA